LYILTLFRIIHSGAEREEQWRICEEHPCIDVIELIEESVIQFHAWCCFSVHDAHMFLNVFLSLYAFSFEYAVQVILEV
jgi:hypothetical protein